MMFKNRPSYEKLLVGQGNNLLCNVRTTSEGYEDVGNRIQATNYVRLGLSRALAYPTLVVKKNMTEARHLDIEMSSPIFCRNLLPL